jgi:hypothetical protein
LLAGCGANTTPVQKPAPTSTVSEEDQIRDAIARVSEAQGNADVDDVAALTCAKYRDRVSGPSPDDVPPMNALPLDLFATMPPEELANSLGEEYAGASKASVRALVDALLLRDEAAYKVAMAKVMAETMQVRVDKVENVMIKGRHRHGRRHTRHQHGRQDDLHPRRHRDHAAQRGRAVEGLHTSGRVAAT